MHNEDTQRGIDKGCKNSRVLRLQGMIQSEERELLGCISALISLPKYSLCVCVCPSAHACTYNLHVHLYYGLTMEYSTQVEGLFLHSDGILEVLETNFRRQSSLWELGQCVCP